MSLETETIRPNLSLEDVTKDWLWSKLKDIEKHTEKDVLTIYGSITHSVDIRVRMALEDLKDQKETMLVILHTNGGTVEAVHNIVQILRHHYNYVHFLVPVCAMSAGTVLTLSGDKIYMDYFSRLGPIDPQLVTSSSTVPALSYLRQYERLIKKSKGGRLSSAEYVLLNKLDLAELHQIELAAELSVSLIENWLVSYKFRDWHKTDRIKRKRAKEIAKMLNDHRKWYTHGSSIHKDILEKDIGLKIDDYSTDGDLKKLVWEYFWSLSDHINKISSPSFIHSRGFV